MKPTILKPLIIAIKSTDLLSAVAVRMTKITGKSKTPIHPKHFLDEKPWFIKNLKKKDIVMDIGSGNAQATLKASKYVKKIIAVDYDKTLLKLGEKAAVEKNVKNVIFIRANLENKLTFKSNSFNKVIFLDVLEHLNNRNQILNEIRRVLKKNGIIYLGVPNRQTYWKRLQETTGVCSFSDPDHKIEFTKAEIINLLEQHKFKIIKFGYSTLDIPFRGVVDIVGSISLTIYKTISDIRKKAAIRFPDQASGFQITLKNTK